jgi:hypothetical protein
MPSDRLLGMQEDQLRHQMKKVLVTNKGGPE